MKTSAKGYLKRFAMLFGGLIVAAYGVSMTVVSNLGVSPWDVFAQGTAIKLSAVFGTTVLMGTMIRAIGWVVLILSILLKEKVGFGTITDIVIVGSFINFFTTSGVVPNPEQFIWRIVLMMIGFVVWSFGVYLYLAAELGAGPRDSLMAALAKRNIPVSLAKNSIEAVVFVIGWIMGGTVGIGTVIAVFIMGYLIKFWFVVFKFDIAEAKNESVLETVKNISALVKK